MSLSAMKWVFDHSKTRGSARVLMLVLADMSNDDGECWPGKARLASKVNVQPRQIIKLVQECERLGELRVVSTKEGKINDTNRYLLTKFANSKRIMSARSVKPKKGETLPPSVLEDTTLVSGSTLPPSVLEDTQNQSSKTKDKPKLPVDATASTAGQSSTPVESRTAALRDYGNRMAEHIEALPPVSIDDFGKTDIAEGYAVTPPPPRTEPLEEVKTALAELFGWKHEGVLHNYGRMLRGIVSKRKTAYDEYAFIGQPVSADELRGFVASWKRAHPGLDLPQTPDAMARHVSAYRASVTNTAPGGSDDPFSRFTIE